MITALAKAFQKALNEYQAAGTKVDSLKNQIAAKEAQIKANDIEIWEVTNKSEMPHPFHIHDVQFLILTRNETPPMENERGLKDVVLVNSQETVKLIAQFSEYSDPDIPYMYHCHILEHEDAGMMGQFVVV